MKKFLPRIILLVFLKIFSGEAISQVCPGVPTYEVNLAGNIDSIWNSPPDVRNGNCCNTNFPDRCIAFRLTLDPGAAGIIFDLTSGAIPSGSLYYQVDCGPQQTVGSAMCLSGTGPFNLTFCKPGSNLNTYRITSIPAIAINAATTDVNCFNGTNGSINITPSHGMPPYTFTWSDGSTSQNRTNLAAGTYSVTVSGTNMCATSSRSLSVTISQPTLLDATASPNPVACFGGATGSINLNISGGTLPYTYMWNDNVTTPHRANVTAGNYSVTVTDSKGCTTSESISIQQPPAPLSVSTVVNHVTCFGLNNGSINLTVAGGTTPYAFQWNGGLTTQNRNNLSGGVYSVTVTDKNGCTTTTSATIQQPSTPLNISGTVTHVGCFGGSNGSITQNVSGGTTPYVYNWGNASTQNRYTLPVGNYVVTVTDANNCTATASYTINQPPVLQVAVASFNHISCYGMNNGSINITATGGASPYQYVWNDVVTSQNRNNLAPGNYAVTVTDANSCTASVSRAIQQPTAPLSVTASNTNITCFGQNNGSINLTVNGGTPAYSYQWVGGISTQNRNNLTPGSYSVTVTDNNGCTVSTTSSIQQPSAPLNNSGSMIHVNCFGGNNGAITQTTNGGTTPYTYNWGNVTTQNRINLAAGTYNVTVTDANLCTATSSYQINQPSQVQTTVTSATNVSCHGMNNGAINISATGGVGPYQYVWNDAVTTKDRTNLSPGNYSVTATDANGCTGIAATVVITQPGAPLDASANVTDVACHSGNTGSVNLNVSGGTSPYTFNWNNGSTAQNPGNLSTGTYEVTVTDAKACTFATSADVLQPNAALIASCSVTNVTCYGGNNGAASVNATGGTPPYTYYWAAGFTQKDIGNLSAANYPVTVTDSKGCKANSSALVGQPPQFSVSATPVDAKCFGGADGSVKLSVSGGTPLYTFKWSNGAITQDIVNLTSGSYGVVIRDANNCTAGSSAGVGQPDPVQITSKGNDVRCYGESSGSVSINVTGGTGSYTYRWNNNATTKDLNNIPMGTYSLTVTDENNCKETAVKIITQPSLLKANETHTSVLCHGATTSQVNLAVSGGTPTYKFAWSNGATTQNLQQVGAGTYSVLVTDKNGCSVSRTATITQPAELQLGENHQNVSCYNLSDGYVHLTVSGGTPSYSFQWNNGSTSQNLNQITSGIYSVTLTDANGCQKSIPSLLVTQPDSLDFSITATDVACNGDKKGTLHTQVAGGTLPYIYSWSNQSAAPHQSGLAKGNYSLTITDANGCSQNGSAFIDSIPPMQISYTAEPLACAEAKGSIDVTVTGGKQPYQFLWNNGRTGEDLIDIHPGDYFLSINDASGCVLDTAIVLFNLNSFQVTAWGGGTIKLGQSAPINSLATGSQQTTYQWLPSTALDCETCPNTTARPVRSTLYTVIATDTNGCVASDTVSVNVISDHSLFNPNAFTPNNDGTNDFYELFGNKDGIRYLHFMIFNRWGEMIFETTEPGFKWDGTYKGELLPPSVFVYVMNVAFLDQEQSEIRKGSITLIR